jgi:hypothetical protein
MKINDTRHLKAGVKFKGMEQGEVYVDVHGNYVLMTAESAVVLLGSGYVFDDTYYDLENDEFTRVNARLEIE